MNKTMIPGMDDNARGDFYSRGSASPIYGGTMVPGMQESAVSNVGDSIPGVSGSVRTSSAPVVGFLYSISRCGIGEYWPLHVGTNTIGRSADNDIQLKEMSVSDHHAFLAVRMMKTSGKLIASVRDNGSKNGMYLNDEELDFENHSCKNGDILTVGTSYKLVLLLINPNEYGLSVADNFVSMEEEEEVGFNDLPSMADDPYARRQRNEGGTVSLSGMDGDFDIGGTQMM